MGLVGGRGSIDFFTASALGLKIESLGRKWSITPPYLSLLEMQRELYFLALFFQLLLCIFPLHLYWSALHGDNRDEINGFPCQFVLLGYFVWLVWDFFEVSTFL